METKRRDQDLKKQEEERRQREEFEHKRRLVEAINDANETNGNKAYAPVIKRFEWIGLNCFIAIALSTTERFVEAIPAQHVR